MPEPLIMDFWVGLNNFSHLLWSQWTLLKCEIPGLIKLGKSLFSRTLEGRCFQRAALHMLIAHSHWWKEYDMASGSVSYDKCPGVRGRGGRQEFLEPPNLRTWGLGTNEVGKHTAEVFRVGEIFMVWRSIRMRRRSRVKSQSGQDHNTGLSLVSGTSLEYPELCRDSGSQADL